MALNMTVYVTVEDSSVGLVQGAFDRSWSTALDIVKCQIPAIATMVTSGDSDISGVVYMKGCVTNVFLELTGL